MMMADGYGILMNNGRPMDLSIGVMLVQAKIEAFVTATVYRRIKDTNLDTLNTTILPNAHIHIKHPSTERVHRADAGLALCSGVHEQRSIHHARLSQAAIRRREDTHLPLRPRPHSIHIHKNIRKYSLSFST